MEEVIQIDGGYRLNGELKVPGAKNATVALMPAAILGNGVITMNGVPDIADVDSLNDLLEELGVTIIKHNKDSYVLDTLSLIHI